MKVQILGIGRAKCKQLTANAEQAVRELGLERRSRRSRTRARS